MDSGHLRAAAADQETTAFRDVADQRRMVSVYARIEHTDRHACARHAERRAYLIGVDQRHCFIQIGVDWPVGGDADDIWLAGKGLHLVRGQRDRQRGHETV